MDSPDNEAEVRASSPEPEMEVIDEMNGSSIEVVLPGIPPEQRDQYGEVHSQVIEDVLKEKVARSGKKYFVVKFTDCRKELLSERRINLYLGGESLPAMNRKAERKRKREETGASGDDSFGSESSGSSDAEVFLSEVSSGSDDAASDSDSFGERPRQIVTIRRKLLANMNGETREPSSDDELNAEASSPDVLSRPRARSTRSQAVPSTHRVLRARPQAPVEIEDDESDDESSMMVVSDIVTRGRQSASRPKLRRLRQQLLRKSVKASRVGDESDIEFEEPRRRSSRATQNKASMNDDSLMDDESFYVEDDKPPGAPRVPSVRETYPPPPEEFEEYHRKKCDSCDGSSRQGPLIYCQGCSMAWHRTCLGQRSTRLHLSTKVGENQFVLQCKYCILTHRNKTPTASRYDSCQTCRESGRSCNPFSERKTTRQEERLREENGGVDPIWPVAAELIDNPENVLFRCIGCHRAWHMGHLPPARGSEVATDVRSERLKDYSIDWQCNDCSSAPQKIDKLVAWRPTQESGIQPREGLLSSDVGEDDKEYLVGWEGKSYAHCVWYPGAWVVDVVPGAMTKAFNKRDMHFSSLHLTSEAAVPDEYLMLDVILKIKLKDGTLNPHNREVELANIDNVSKIMVKFQGLSYHEVVWDRPPAKDNTERYTAFQEAYHDYVERKYFSKDNPTRIRERIREFRSEEFAEVEGQPASMQRGKLMQYQVEGLNWLLENFHKCKSVVLADEMGLGKTVQVISLVTSLIHDNPHCWPFLIVVPNATCPNWRREFKQWSPNVRCVTYHGGKEPQDLAYKHELFPGDSTQMKAHVVIMSYDSAQDPATKIRFKTVKWVGLVVDEGQRLKNDKNILYSALRSMTIPFRLLLTGTPLQNNKRELFNLLQFIDDTQNAEELDEEYEILDKESLPRLHELIRPYFLRRTKVGVLKFLPAMAQIILPVTMTVIQERLSRSIMAKNDELIKAIVGNSKLNKKERGSLSNILMQLRKCLCHPFVYAGAIEERHHDAEVLHRNLVEASPKLILFQVMLPKLRERGHRVLIFSQFLMQLDIIEDFLTMMGLQFRRLDGTISSLEKQRRIDAFNEPGSEIFAFLLSTRAGGVGINLATADTVIIMDPDFNPHQDLQALSRAHRIGQKKKVLCFQLVTKDSVEERMMQIGRKKMALDHALIESMDDADLGGDDLESILRHGAQALFDENYQKEAIHYDEVAIDKLLDRSEVEVTEVNEEGSGESQFTHARVWSNEKSGFDSGFGLEEDEAPEPLSSSVWDSIIKMREAEAQMEKERREKEIASGRRRSRKVVNYKTNVVIPELNADGGDSSEDPGDAFENNEMDEDSDDMETPSGREEEGFGALGEGPRYTKSEKAIRAAHGAATNAASLRTQGSTGGPIAYIRGRPFSQRVQPVNAGSDFPAMKQAILKQSGYQKRPKITVPQQFPAASMGAHMYAGQEGQVVGAMQHQQQQQQQHQRPLTVLPSNTPKVPGPFHAGNVSQFPNMHAAADIYMGRSKRRPTEALIRLALDELQRSEFAGSAVVQPQREALWHMLAKVVTAKARAGA